jgi:shikimate kinase
MQRISMQRISLIGYRGTGKTTVARLLADRLGWQSADADELLEWRAGRTIRQIFADEGEAAFRDQEASVLAELCTLDRLVLATGGGVILRPENRTLLRTGQVVWLTATAEVLWRRLCGDTTTSHRRPDLAQGGLAEIEELLRLRAPLYAECADWTVDTAAQAPEDVTDAIFRWFENR